MISTKEEKTFLSEGEIKKKLQEFRTEELKAEYLENILKKKLSNETKRFVCISLSEIYKKRGYFLNAARFLEHAAISAEKFKDAQELWKEAARLYIKANELLTADDCFKKVMESCSESEKKKIQEEIKKIYAETASEFERERKLREASKIYERLLSKELSSEERRDVREKLARIYEKLGKIREAISLRQA